MHPNIPGGKWFGSRGRLPKLRMRIELVEYRTPTVSAYLRISNEYTSLCCKKKRNNDYPGSYI